MTDHHRISLHQLRMLTTVAEAGGISRAAAMMHLTQPTISIQLKQLAETVGQPLLEFTGRRLHLTDAGHAVVATARAIEDQLLHLRSRLAGQRGLQEGRLRIAAVSTAEYFLPRLLGEFHQRFPGVQVALSVLNRAAVLERLEANTDDVYVMTRPPEDRSIRAELLGPNPLVLVAATSHPWAKRARIPARELSNQPLIVREPGSGTRLWGDEWLAARKVRYRTSLELGSNEAIKQAVRGGLGIAVLSAHSVLLELEQGLVSVLRLTGTPIKSSWHLVSRADHPVGPTVEAFRRYARQMMPDISRSALSAIRAAR